MPVNKLKITGFLPNNKSSNISIPFSYSNAHRKSKMRRKFIGWKEKENNMRLVSAKLKVLFGLIFVLNVPFISW